MEEPTSPARREFNQPDALAEATDRFVDACVEDPNASLLEMFEKHR